MKSLRRSLLLALVLAGLSGCSWNKCHLKSDRALPSSDAVELMKYLQFTFNSDNELQIQELVRIAGPKGTTSQRKKQGAELTAVLRPALRQAGVSDPGLAAKVGFELSRISSGTYTDPSFFAPKYLLDPIAVVDNMEGDASRGIVFERIVGWESIVEEVRRSGSLRAQLESDLLRAIDGVLVGTEGDAARQLELARSSAALIVDSALPLYQSELSKKLDDVVDEIRCREITVCRAKTFRIPSGYRFGEAAGEKGWLRGGHYTIDNRGGALDLSGSSLVVRRVQGRNEDVLDQSSVPVRQGDRLLIVQPDKRNDVYNVIHVVKADKATGDVEARIFAFEKPVHDLATKNLLVVRWGDVAYEQKRLAEEVQSLPWAQDPAALAVRLEALSDRATALLTYRELPPADKERVNNFTIAIDNARQDLAAEAQEASSFTGEGKAFLRLKEAAYSAGLDAIK